MDSSAPNHGETLEDRAHSWVSQFAPLILADDSVTDETQVRTNLQLIGRLRELATELEPCVRDDPQLDSELATTFQASVAQLDLVESGLRRKLAKLAPGDPSGIVDYEELNEALAERAAREEVGLQEHGEVLRSLVSSGNLGVAAFMGVFGLGWTAFTAFHATLMIGGMMQAFGAVALALLGFYAIFFFVGFSMIAAAFHAGSKENITIDGRELTLTKSFGPFTRTKSVRIARESVARVGASTITFGNQGQGKGRSILVTDESGKTVGFGAFAEESWRNQLCEKINAYLKLHND